MGFIVILVAYCASLASIRHSGNMCFSMIFSKFLGIFLVISCIVDSLNLFGIPAGEGGEGKCNKHGGDDCLGVIFPNYFCDFACKDVEEWLRGRQTIEGHFL